MEAAARGMHVRGYSPTDADKARLAAIQRKSEFRGRETSNSVEGKRTREQDKAEAFKSEQPETAMKKYPDLAGAYAGVEAARRHVEKEQLSSDEAKVVMARINKNAQNSIERGHIPQVQVNERSQGRDLEKEAAAHRHREKELGR